MNDIRSDLKMLSLKMTYVPIYKCFSIQYMLCKTVFELKKIDIPPIKIVKNKIYTLEFNLSQYENYDISILFFDLIHVLSHSMLNQFDRGSNLDEKIWNESCDLFINVTFIPMLIKHEILIVKDIKMDLNTYEKYKIERKIKYDKKYFNLTEYQIYNMLINDSQVQQNNTDLSYNNQDICNNLFEQDMINNTNKQQDIKDETILNECDYILGKELLHAYMKSDNHRKYFEKILEAIEYKIDWQQILRDSLTSYLCKYDSYGWSSIRLTSFTTGIILPGKITEEKVESVVVAIDQSGSMETNVIEKGISTIVECSEFYQKLFILKHDTKVVEMLEFDMLNDINKHDIMDSILTRVCYGGTSHKDVFDKINVMRHENISTILLFTDGISDIEEYIHLVNDIPIFIINTSNRNIKGLKNIFVN